MTAELDSLQSLDEVFIRSERVGLAACTRRLALSLVLVFVNREGLVCVSMIRDVKTSQS
jgi:hypothetical protein